MAHWRDSARTPTFYFIDALAAIPMLLYLLHMKLWTFVLAIIATIFFTILRRFGFTLPVFLRWLRGVATGKRKVSAPWWKY